MCVLYSYFFLNLLCFIPYKLIVFVFGIQKNRGHRFQYKHYYDTKKNLLFLETKAKLELAVKFATTRCEYYFYLIVSKHFIDKTL